MFALFLTALLGFATTIIPRWFTYYVSCGLFAIFGIKMLREGNNVVHSVLFKLKVRKSRALSETPPRGYGMSLAIWDHTVLLAIQHK